MDTLQRLGAFIFVSSFLNYTDITLPTGYTCCQKPITCSCRCENNFLTAENFSKNRKQQLKGGTYLQIAREKGLLIELNCH